MIGGAGAILARLAAIIWGISCNPGADELVMMLLCMPGYLKPSVETSSSHQHQSSPRNTKLLLSAPECSETTTMTAWISCLITNLKAQFATYLILEGALFGSTAEEKRHGHWIDRRFIRCEASRLEFCQDTPGAP